MVLGKLLKFLKKEQPKNKILKKKSSLKIPKKRVPKKSIKKKIAVKAKTPAVKKEKLIARAVHYYAKINVAVLKLKEPLSLNDKIHIRGFTTNIKQPVSSMQIDHTPVSEAKRGQEIGIKVKGKVRHGDKVYKI